jgi:hypothetical protein
MMLVEFLLARIDEDEKGARLAICQCGGSACTVESGWYDTQELVARLDDIDSAAHVAQWGPARVLAECEAKRRIVAGHPSEEYFGDLYCNVCGSGSELGPGDDWPCPTLCALALPYADHPDYDPTWRP